MAPLDEKQNHTANEHAHRHENILWSFYNHQHLPKITHLICRRARIRTQGANLPVQGFCLNWNQKKYYAYIAFDTYLDLKGRTGLAELGLETAPSTRLQDVGLVFTTDTLKEDLQWVITDLGLFQSRSYPRRPSVVRGVRQLEIPK